MLAPPEQPLHRSPTTPPPWRTVPAELPGRWHRTRRIALAAAVLCLIPAFVSFAQAIAQPSNSSFFIKAVEWMRDNGARRLVTDVENIYYSLSAPSKGGPTLRALPKQAAIAAGGLTATATATLPRRSVAPRFYKPHRIRPVIRPALPGEGVWHATFARGGSRPPVLVTSFRPDATYPQQVAGVAWIDHTRTSTWLYPGRLEPAVSLLSRGPMEVPPRLRGRLVATFNSGFKLRDSGGGFAEGGRTYAPM
jgi:hypothetical protein